MLYKHLKVFLIKKFQFHRVIAYFISISLKVPEPQNSCDLIIMKVNKLTQYEQLELLVENRVSLHHFLAIQRELYKRRCAFEPLQYIFGEWPFGSLNLILRKPVLIPRSETEFLLNLIYEKFHPSGIIQILEIGTGTGGIILNLLKHYKQSQGIGIDISLEAYKLTKLNAKMNKIDNLQMIHGSFNQFLQNQNKLFDLIVSNPPYIKLNEYEQLNKQVRLYEDKNALVSGEDGLDLIRQIIHNINFILKPGGTLFMECNQSHILQLEELLQSIGKYEHCFLNDQYGIKRFLYLKT